MNIGAPVRVGLTNVPGDIGKDLLINPSIGIEDIPPSDMDRHVEFFHCRSCIGRVMVGHGILILPQAMAIVPQEFLTPALSNSRCHKRVETTMGINVIADITGMITQ